MSLNGVFLEGSKLSLSPSPLGFRLPNAACCRDTDEQVAANRVRERRHAREEIHLILLLLLLSQYCPLVLDLVAITNLILHQGQ
jgi:hypothetical protein